jgi:ABC-type antimicrobial peptide transport system permease subunit
MDPVLRLLFYSIGGGVVGAIVYSYFFWSTFSILILFLVYTAVGTVGMLIAATYNYRRRHKNDN